MAEGFARQLGAGAVEAWSAGIIAAGVNENAAAVMREAGVDISAQRSKTIDEIPMDEMDLVVTLCDNAARFCPDAPAGGRKLHVPVKDPVGATGAPEDVLNDFRRAREEIRAIVSGILDGIAAAPPPSGKASIH